jgi:diguanylate cyclase (GGDEF)-like protein
MEWSLVDRCIFVGTLMFLFGASYWAMDEYFVLDPTLAPYYDRPFLEGFQRALVGFCAAWGALIALGIALRKRRPNSRILVHATIQLYSIGNAIGAVCVGPVTSPHVIVLLGGAVVGIFLFDWRVLYGIASAVLALTIGSILVAAGVMPYAPLLAAPPYVGGRISGWWIAQMSAVGFSVSVAVLFMFAYLIARLRDREARLLRLSRTDVLTGVANRRHFIEVFAREFDRAKRYGTPLACVLLDLDHFKQINDRFGHLVGDRVIVAAAEAFGRSLRAHDALARWGGEEFVVLLPQTDLAGAESVAERCRSSLDETVIDTGSGTLHVTVSVGVAAHPEPSASSGDELLRRADEALYRAKKGGRNRVASLPPPAEDGTEIVRP